MVNESLMQKMFPFRIGNENQIVGQPNRIIPKGAERDPIGSHNLSPNASILQRHPHHSIFKGRRVGRGPQN